MVLNLQTAMVLTQFHLSYDNFFETVLPTASNPLVYSHWQALTVLRKHEIPLGEPKSTPPNMVERPKTIVIWDAPDSSSEEGAKSSLWRTL